MAGRLRSLAGSGSPSFLNASFMSTSPASLSLSSSVKSWLNSSSRPLSSMARSASVLVPLEYLTNISCTSGLGSKGRPAPERRSGMEVCTIVIMLASEASGSARAGCRMDAISPIMPPWLASMAVMREP